MKIFLARVRFQVSLPAHSINGNMHHGHDNDHVLIFSSLSLNMSPSGWNCPKFLNELAGGVSCQSCGVNFQEELRNTYFNSISINFQSRWNSLFTLNNFTSFWLLNFCRKYNLKALQMIDYDILETHCSLSRAICTTCSRDCNTQWNAQVAVGTLYCNSCFQSCSY